MDSKKNKIPQKKKTSGIPVTKYFFFPFILLVLGIYKLFVLVPSDRDKLIVQGEVEYVKYVTNYEFKSVGAKVSDGYLIKLQSGEEIYEVYFLKDCEKLSTFKEEPGKARLLVDRRRNIVLELDINNTSIFKYDLWSRISFWVWAIVVGLAFSILTVIYLFYEIRKGSKVASYTN